MIDFDNTEYRIDKVSGCVIVYGSFPIDIMSAIVKLVPKNAVMDTHVARLLGATIVGGLEHDLDALAKDPGVLAEARARSERELAGQNLPAGALEWHATGRRGLSSNAIFHHLLGLPMEDKSAVPSDASDFARCRRLLEQVPDLVAKLPAMADLSPAWAAMVKNWDVIASTMDRECPQWREHLGPCPETGAALQQYQPSTFPIR